jgi:predicted PurR-regulated permease PerM
LVGLISVVMILLAAKKIFIIIILATFFAIILSPIVNFLERKILSRSVAMIFTILIFLLIGAIIGAIVLPSLNRFIGELPTLIRKLHILLTQFTDGASGYFNISTQVIEDLIVKAENTALNNISAQLGKTLSLMGSFLVELILIPVYMFMLLYYQPLLMEFILKISGKDHERRVHNILIEIKKTIKNYLVGLLIEAIIVATLYSTGLLIIGIE